MNLKSHLYHLEVIVYLNGVLTLNNYLIIGLDKNLKYFLTIAKKYFTVFDINMNSKFSLISKTIGTKFTEYKGNAVRLSQFSPYSVDEVILKSNANPKEIRKVTTFRDSKGDIVERSFDYTGRQLKNRLYSTVDNVIGNDEFVTSKTTKDYSIDRGILSTYKELIQRPKINRFIFWSPDKTTTHHISENIETGEKILSQVQISSKRKSLKQHHLSQEPSAQRPDRQQSYKRH